ncbi:TPA: TRAP transporter small permease [Escherichia coli]|uniref:TRAP transporter small permease n=1 Tax=Escherichia coli TaxID=562 RepID=UPI00143035DA|nr:TRAP transporter small permease [Escherichia coli]EHB7663904.1 TRAP transporter small permease [Escherichia coli]EHD2969378.1 TRAP transporter small permease [Escherichia coli]EHE9877386.1 TRAP transporter small permease [Escherichia coli]EII9938690.1 TRAP transporter small permease [Escherichia coli]
MRLLGKLIEVAAVLTLFILVIMTITAVIMRYCFHMPLQWTEEVSGLLMIWVVMFGAIVAERDNTHLSIPFLADALTPRWQRVLTFFVSLISIILLIVMAWSAWKLAAGTAFKTTQILKISWFWIDIAVTVGAIGITCFTALHLIKKTPRKESE